MPDEAFSLNILPINIPIAINKTAITIEIKAAHIIFILKLSPKIIASIKNKIF